MILKVKVISDLTTIIVWYNNRIKVQGHSFKVITSSLKLLNKPGERVLACSSHVQANNSDCSCSYLSTKLRTSMHIIYINFILFSKTWKILKYYWPTGNYVSKDFIDKNLHYYKTVKIKFMDNTLIHVLKPFYYNFNSM